MSENNLSKGWTQTIEGETLEDLYESVYAAVELQKIDVWYICRNTVQYFYFFVQGITLARLLMPVK